MLSLLVVPIYAKRSQIDSTIAPPHPPHQTSDSFDEPFIMATRHEDIVLFAKNFDVFVARGTVFQEVRPGERWFKNRRFR